MTILPIPAQATQSRIRTPMVCCLWAWTRSRPSRRCARELADAYDDAVDSLADQPAVHYNQALAARVVSFQQQTAPLYLIAQAWLSTTRVRWTWPSASST